VTTAYRRRWDGEDTACLGTADEEQNYRFKAHPIQKAVEEHSLVEDYMVVEWREQRHGTLKTYEFKSSKERKIRPTHHTEFNVFDKAHKGNMFKLVRRYNTAAQRSGCSLNNTVNCVQIEAMMSQTLGVDADEMIDDKKEAPDEEPPEEHADQDRDRLFKDMTEVTAPRQKAMQDNN
jgi:hypothetical protein